MTKEEAIYILRNTAFLAPSLAPIDEAIEMACEALKQADTPQTERPCDNCQEFDCYGCEYKEERASDERRANY